VWNAPVPSPFLDRTSWWIAESLDVAAMDRAAQHVVGEHDFTTCCRRPRDGDGVSLVRRVESAGWTREPSSGGEAGPGGATPGDAADLVVFRIRASAFCHQMVRSIVGLLVEVGRGRRREDDVAAALEARDRSRLPTLAPPRGLTLWDVGY
jgi:tRNA pseudouridine38-40 synthase